MATDNRGVMVYLPSEVETKIIEYCTEYNITRKDKQGNIVTSLGSGIVAYLKSQLLGDTPRSASDRLTSGLTRSEVLDLIAESSTSNTPIDGLPNPLDPAIVHRLEAIEQQLSSPTAMSRDEVGQLIQASEQRVMEAVRSLKDELMIDEQVNIPLTEISTTNKEKAIEATVKSIVTKGKKNSVTSDLNPTSKGIRRWLKHLQDQKFKEIIQAGVSNKYSNREIVSRLFDVGYGKDNNTKPYPDSLANAMKNALLIEVDDRIQV